MKEKFLPIGTVVLLKDATKKLMITGYCSMLPTDQTKIYDYVGTLFPEGNIAGEDVALFDHEQISVVEHMGLENDEYKEFNTNLINAMNEETPILGDDANSFMPQNINDIMQNLDVVKEQMLGPTEFDEEKLKVPSFDMASSLTSASDGVSVSIEEADDVIVEDGDNGDGSPVLQLEPIFIDKNVSDDGSSNSGGIFELERL